MRISHVITRMIVGGAMENTLLSCEGQHAAGHEVTLVTGPALGPEGELLSRARAGGYDVIVLDSLRREIHPLRDARAYREIRDVLRRLHPDIVHSHASKAGILARRAAARIGEMGIVHTIHGLPFHPYQSWWRNRLYVMMERRAARVSDALISVADAMTRQALAAGVGRAEQYTTIYSGMEVDRFLARPPETDAFRQSLGLPPDAVLVTQVSRLAELKGHEFILAAAEQVDDPRVHYAFVGDGPWRERIERQIARLSKAGRFHLTGLVAPQEIPSVMHASDIVVHCSLREGLARALPQAMLAGKPVIAFDVDGEGEVVDSSTGVLLQAGDAGGLALAVQTLAACGELRSRLGQAGRQRCRAMFDHHRMVERIERVYRGVLKKRRRPA